MKRLLDASLTIGLLAVAAIVAASKIGPHDSAQSEPAALCGTFPYTFTESTGPNQLIEVRGRDRDICFDHRRSNPRALHSFEALKWEVLYPNSHGGKLTVTGTYESTDGTFVLSDWHIHVPFRRIVVADPEIVPSDERYVVANELRRSDFDPSSAFDPLSRRFEPAAHLIP